MSTRALAWVSPVVGFVVEGHGEIYDTPRSRVAECFARRATSPSGALKPNRQLAHNFVAMDSLERLARMTVRAGTVSFH